MRFSFVNSLLLPLAVVVQGQDALQLHRPNPNNSPTLTVENIPPDGDPIFKHGFTNFELPCQADDEAFNITLEVSHPVPHNCGTSTLKVNGNFLPLPLQFRPAIDNHFTRGSFSIRARSTLNSREHLLELSSKAICSDSSEREEVIVVAVQKIDGAASKARPVITIPGLNSALVPIHIAPVEAIEVEEEGATERPAATETNEPPSEPLSQNESSSSLPPSPSPPQIDDELKRLQYLEDELHEVQQALADQRWFVRNLTLSQDHEAILRLKDCKNLKCLIRTLLLKVRCCIHSFVSKMMPYKHQRPGFDRQKYECRMQYSRQARMQAFINGEKLCTISEDDVAPTPTGQSRPSSSSSASHPAFAHLREHPTPKQVLALAAGSVLSCLCLGYAFHHIRTCCCSPRARAERAARREERRTRRQYRCLARQHAWRTWMSKRFGGRLRSKRNSNYEEKRALILAQEDLLERHMQAEIFRLRRETGASSETSSNTGVRAAEEGRHGGPPSETLPAYRSRASSWRSRGSFGRPPSYHSSDEMTGPASTAFDVAGLQASIDGASAVDGLDSRSASPVSDITPDSSIACISPRNSSETLRTERSVM